MESYACNPSTEEAEARGFGQVRVQPGLYSETPCVRKNKKHLKQIKGKMVCSYNPGTWEIDPEGSGIQGHP